MASVKVEVCYLCRRGIHCEGKWDDVPVYPDLDRGGYICSCECNKHISTVETRRV